MFVLVFVCSTQFTQIIAHVLNEWMNEWIYCHKTCQSITTYVTGKKQKQR